MFWTFFLWTCWLWIPLAIADIVVNIGALANNKSLGIWSMSLLPLTFIAIKITPDGSGACDCRFGPHGFDTPNHNGGSDYRGSPFLYRNLLLTML